MALAPLILVKLFARTRVTMVTLATYAGCLLAVLSHLLLDWTNVYGVRLMLPFNAKWYHLDISNLIDPVILGVLLAALAIPALVALISSEIAGKKSAGPRLAWAWFALVAVLGYDTGRWMAHQRAISLIDAHNYRGAPALRIGVFPVSLFRWRGVVEGDGFVYEVPVDLTQDFDAAGGHTDYPAISSPAIDAARTTRTFQVFENFDQFPFWTLLPVDDTLAGGAAGFTLRIGAESRIRGGRIRRTRPPRSPRLLQLWRTEPEITIPVRIGIRGPVNRFAMGLSSN